MPMPQRKKWLPSRLLGSLAHFTATTFSGHLPRGQDFAAIDGDVTTHELVSVFLAFTSDRFLTQRAFSWSLSRDARQTYN